MTGIELLGLSTRAYNCLRNGGYATVDAVRAASDQDLLDLRNMGVRSLQEIREKIGGGSIVEEVRVGMSEQLRPTAGQPEYQAREVHRDLMGTEPDFVEPAAVGWDLSFGARINFDHDADGDDQYRLMLHLSDDAIANRHVFRTVTREQIFAYAQHLLTLIGASPQLVLPPTEASQRAALHIIRSIAGGEC